MRLIDAEALLYVISPAVEPGGKLYDPDIPAKDMRSYIHDMPNIDAIPVEWLCEKIREEDKFGGIPFGEYLKVLIWEWHQQEDDEQEGR